jgi:uncharacterized protein with HEPN domain
MSKRETKLLLSDIIESIDKIKRYTLGYTFEEFLNDSKTSDAVVRNFEIIGEAANRIPEEIRDQNNQINWHRIKGFRNRIVHDYMGVDYNIVWSIIHNDIDRLRSDISKVLDSE